jgi:DNA-binding transcriptional LysR family regulator
MELRQLEYLVAVVEEANFTRAAERVHVSQSGVSAQIRQLERELGQTLLDRSARQIRPTSAGAAILPHARVALAAVATTRAVADELAGLIRGRVSVGMVTACTVTELFDALSAFHRSFPGIEIALAEDSSDRLIAGVLTGRFDIALLGTAEALPSGVVSDVISDEALVAAVPLDHPLATSGTIGLAELLDYPIVTLPPGSGVRTAFDTACTARGLAPKVALEASAPDVVAGLAEGGMGIGILSETMAGARAALQAVVIDDPPLRSRLELARSAGDSAGPAARAFISRARAAFLGAGAAGPAGGFIDNQHVGQHVGDSPDSFRGRSSTPG